MMSRSEGQQLAANGATTDADDHGWDAWGDEEGEPAEPAEEKDTKPAPAKDEGGVDNGDDDDAADAWGWGDDDATATEAEPGEPTEDKTDDDDATDAWGWGDEARDDDTAAKPELKPTPQAAGSQAREVTFKETYNISSMPQPVLDLISAIVEDGAALTQGTYATSPVAAAAAGLFSLPTLVLAMFRAVSPYYYATDIGGKM